MRFSKTTTKIINIIFTKLNTIKNPQFVDLKLTGLENYLKPVHMISISHRRLWCRVISKLWCSKTINGKAEQMDATSASCFSWVIEVPGRKEGEKNPWPPFLANLTGWNETAGHLNFSPPTRCPQLHAECLPSGSPCQWYQALVVENDSPRYACADSVAGPGGPIHRCDSIFPTTLTVTARVITRELKGRVKFLQCNSCPSLFSSSRHELNEPLGWHLLCFTILFFQWQWWHFAQY